MICNKLNGNFLLYYIYIFFQNSYCIKNQILQQLNMNSMESNMSFQMNHVRKIVSNQYFDIINNSKTNLIIGLLSQQILSMRINRCIFYFYNFLDGTNKTKCEGMNIYVDCENTNKLYILKKKFECHSNEEKCAIVISLKNIKSIDECFLIYKIDKNGSCKYLVLYFNLYHYNEKLTEMKASEKIPLLPILIENFIIIFDYTTLFEKYCILKVKMIIYVWNPGIQSLCFI